MKRAEEETVFQLLEEDRKARLEQLVEERKITTANCLVLGIMRMYREIAGLLIAQYHRITRQLIHELVVYLYYAYACRVTENKIKKILEEAGIIISAGEISNYSDAGETKTEKPHGRA